MAEKKNEAQNEQDKEKKKKGVIIGVIGLAAAAAVAVPLGLKGCAPGERSFTVTFLTDDEVQNFQEKSMNVKDGTTIGSLKNQLAPIDGYDFGGFYKDAECNEPFADSDVVNDDTKIYVKYTEIIITVRFHGEAAAGELENPQTLEISYFDKISDYASQIKEPTKTGHKFSYWRTKDDAYTKIDFSNKELTGKYLLKVDPDRELDLYAEFEVSGYSITIPEGVMVTKNGVRLNSTDRVQEGDELTITADEKAEWIVTGFEVFGVTHETATYTVTGDVEIQVTAAEHRYLTFKLLDDGTYEVTGMKEGATETNIIIPDTHKSDDKAITSILGGEYGRGGAFRDNTTITELTIGKNIKSIGASAFYGCSNLKEIDYKGSLENWLDINFDRWIGNEYSLKIDGKELVELEFSEETTSIPQFAFIHCGSLKSITIPEWVTSIGLYAFTYCDNLTEINFNAINCADCGDNSLPFGNAGYSSGGVTVIFGESVKHIPANLFSNGNSDADMAEITSVIIGNSVESIGDCAFVYSNLTFLIIGSSVTSIGREAFLYCYKLRAVYYNGTSEDWKKISFGDNNTSNPAYYGELYYFSEEQPTGTGNYWHWSEPDASGVRTPVVWEKED